MGASDQRGSDPHLAGTESDSKIGTSAIGYIWDRLSWCECYVRDTIKSTCQDVSIKPLRNNFLKVGHVVCASRAHIHLYCTYVIHFPERTEDRGF